MDQVPESLDGVPGGHGIGCLQRVGRDEYVVGRPVEDAGLRRELHEIFFLLSLGADRCAWLLNGAVLQGPCGRSSLHRRPATRSSGAAPVVGGLVGGCERHLEAARSGPDGVF